MKRPNILSRVYDQMDAKEQELFRKNLVAIGLNPRVFHENYKLDTCKINVMDCYDLMVNILAPDRQFEHPYFVLSDILKRKTGFKPRAVPVAALRPSGQMDLEQIIAQEKVALQDIDRSDDILKAIFMGYSLQIFKLKDGSDLRIDPRKEYHYQKYNGGFRIVPPTRN